jgi:probable phosphoglycerate mutase
LTPTIEPALAEIHLGNWEGLTPEEVNARFGGAYELWRTTPSQMRIPGAEPLERFRARVQKVVSQILREHHDGELVIVSHGGVIAALLADWLGADYDQLLRRLVLDNAGISAIDGQANPPHVLWINATDHLTNHLRSIQSSG